MIPFIILGILIIGCVVAHLKGVFEREYFWKTFATIFCIVLCIMGGFWVGNKFATRQAVVNYNTWVNYLQSIQTKKINQSERQNTLDSISTVNQNIANCKLNEDDLWIGIWTPKIGYLKPLDFNSVPQAVDNKDLNITNQH